MLQQHTANQRTKCCPAGTDRRPDAKRHITVALFSKSRTNTGQRRRDPLRFDLLGQFAFDTKFPVGVITGILGAPYLLYLLIRTSRRGGSS